MSETFQNAVGEWCKSCFGPEILADKAERNHRFLEESLELVQSLGCTASEAHQLVDYVFGRPVGHGPQECGGVMVTLAALCEANHMDLIWCAETELHRVKQNIEKIRAKNAAKPKHSPLPGAVAEDAPVLTTKECEVCGYVFSRYLAHSVGGERKREQQICPQCGVPRFLVEVRHPGEKL